MLICVFPHYEEIVSDTEDTAGCLGGPWVPERLCILIFWFFACEIVLSIQIEA